jgi:hypothetical protein
MSLVITPEDPLRPSFVGVVTGITLNKPLDQQSI